MPLPLFLCAPRMRLQQCKQKNVQWIPKIVRGSHQKSQATHFLGVKFWSIAFVEIWKTHFFFAHKCDPSNYDSSNAASNTGQRGGGGERGINTKIVQIWNGKLFRKKKDQHKGQARTHQHLLAHSHQYHIAVAFPFFLVSITENYFMRANTSMSV